jgi:hypothetical protein
MEAWRHTWLRDELDYTYGQELTFGSNEQRTAWKNYLQQEMDKLPNSQTFSLTSEQRRIFDEGRERDKEHLSNPLTRPAFLNML